MRDSNNQSGYHFELDQQISLPESLSGMMIQFISEDMITIAFATKGPNTYSGRGSWTLPNRQTDLHIIMYA